jgi:hypothetical protein
MIVFDQAFSESTSEKDVKALRSDLERSGGKITKIAIKAAAQSGVSPSLVAGLQVRDEEEITYSLQCDGVFHQSEFLACAGSFPLT